MIEFDAIDATAVAFAIGAEYCGDEEMRKNASGDHRSRIDLQLAALKLADYATALAAHPWA